MLTHHFGLVLLCLLYTLILSWRLEAMASSESQSLSMASSLASQICSHSLHLLQTHPLSPAGSRPLSRRAILRRQNSPIRGRKRRPNAQGTLRLAYLGLSAHLVFDMTTPPITANDLLIASAGPGGFSTVDALCWVAQCKSVASNGSAGDRVVLTHATGASVVGYVPAQTMADDKGGEAQLKEPRELLPMGSVYEGALCCLRWLCLGSVRFWSKLRRPLELVTQTSNEAS